MNHIGRGNVKHPYVFQSGLATHVVTGILYGSHAFFVLDREVSEKEDRQEIEGNLKVLIRKIPKLDIEGKGALKMRDADFAKVDKFSCKFHGDFHLERHPVSFQEAIEVYQSLPTLLGSNRKNTVPQKVWLMPLKNLDSAAAQLVRQISDRLISDAQNILEDLGELESRCNDAEKWPIHQQFPQIKKKVKTFKGLVSQFKLEFQKTMARKLPLIRGGGEEEGILAKILKSVQSSPFNSIDLNEWMDCKKTESKIIRSLVDNMLHMTLVTSRSSLQREIHRGDATHTVSFVFTSLETPEPYLSALSNYLDEVNKPDYVPCKYDVEKEQWFFSDEEMDKVQQKIKLFKDFAEANRENRSIRFLTAALRDDERKGAIVRLYTDGFSVNDNFEPPSKPTMITCGITHNSVTLNISPPRFGLAAVINYAVEVCVHIDDVWLQHMECQAGDVTVSGLKSDEEYRFRCRAMCAVGLGPACGARALIKTLSPPQVQEPMFRRPHGSGSLRCPSSDLQPICNQSATRHDQVRIHGGLRLACGARALFKTLSPPQVQEPMFRRPHGSGSLRCPSSDLQPICNQSATRHDQVRIHGGLRPASGARALFKTLSPPQVQEPMFRRPHGSGSLRCPSSDLQPICNQSATRHDQVRIHGGFRRPGTEVGRQGGLHGKDSVRRQ
ncbi:hypothetical protein NHX12_004592 [Muraenolepis orangiensis]|uniref:Fibronectin type-III domain-containing protein n=1 Tax=Muraenolepis orangiensis TaxID=630683 RepID=A0A9Q0IER6_9TELE|nr:hypothetical protein NHX12_004592 [Muraenolepis orangiensis]